VAEATDILRDALFGNPPTSAKEPSREGVLAAFGNLEARATTAIAGAIAGIIYYATGAERAADTTRPIGTLGKAADEADYYRRDGSGWVVDNTVYQGVASVVQPQISEVQDAVNGLVSNVSNLVTSIDGDLLTGVSASGVQPQYSNGAVARLDTLNRPLGITIPSGQSGRDSLVLVNVKVEGPSLTGSDVALYYQVDTSANYDRGLSMTLIVQTIGGASEARETTPLPLDATASRSTVGVRYTMRGDEAVFLAFVQLANTNATSAQQWMMVSGIALRVLNAPGLLTATDLASNVTRQRDIARAIKGAQSVTPTIKTVKPSGGDFNSPAAAMAGITDASATKPYVVKIYPNTGDGSWPCIELTPKDYIDLEGVGPARVWLKGYQAPSTSPALITQNSTLRWHSRSVLTNLRVTAQNMRYATHTDNPNESYNKLVDYNCEWEHFGNQEARDYQTSQGNDPNVIWASIVPFGSGTWPGERRIHNFSIFRGPTAYLAHNTNDEGTTPPTLPTPQPDAARVTLIGCLLESTAGASATAVNLQSFGTGQTDVLELIGCKVIGNVEMTRQRGTENNWLVTGYGNIGLTFTGAAVRQSVIAA